jgi:3-hydroxyisobutyrate dehydrogenase-like beta-hydroxyacid dehydrogenase
LQTPSIDSEALMKVGFIGLGQMGRGMAARLLDRGHTLVVWNRSESAAQALRERGAAVARYPEATGESEVVITMLADDAAIESVWIASRLLERMPPGAVHLNMASVSLRMATLLTTLHRECGREYVSAPVFGRPQAARDGQLDIIAAGARESIARCVPLFEALGKHWFDLGETPAHANIVKIARNYLLGTIIESLGEAFALVAKSDVAPAKFLDVLTRTSLDCPAYRNYGRLILEPPAHPTFTLTLGRKDVELALEAGRDTGVPMPAAETLRDQHVAAIAAGYGEGDWASLGNYIAACAGLKT